MLATIPSWRKPKVLRVHDQNAGLTDSRSEQQILCHSIAAWGGKKVHPNFAATFSLKNLLETRHITSPADAPQVPSSET